MSSKQVHDTLKAMDRFIQWHLRSWGWGLLFSFIIIWVGLTLGRSVKLNTDLESLLPREALSVIHWEQIKPKAGGSYDIRLVLEGGPFETRLKAAEAFSDFLNRKPQTVRSVRFRTPKEFFLKHKYELIPLDGLEAIHRRLKEEKKEWSEVTDPLGLEAELEEEEAVTKEVQEKDEAQLKTAKELLKRLDEMQSYYQTRDGKFLAIRIVPWAETLDIEKNRSLLEEFKQLAHQFNFSQFHPELRVSFHGSIVEHLERYDSIVRDVQFGGFGILLIFLIVILYFRSAWAPLVLVPPLVTGLALGLGVISLLEGALNTIAVFLILVVFGVGIEFGIHLWARMIEERKTKSVEESLLNTWKTTARATITSSLALLAGFAILTLSSFQGFAQFGRVAIILIMCTSGSFLFFMPAWIMGVERLRGTKSWPHKFQISYDFFQKLKMRGGALLRFFSLLFSLVGVVLCIFYFRFDYGFDEGVIKTNRAASETALDKIFTERLKPSALAVFKTEPEAFQFLDHYRKNSERYPDIALLSGLQTFLPPDLSERIKKLRSIADDFEFQWAKKIKDEDIKTTLKEIKEKAYTLKPYAVSDLPIELKQPFLATDNSKDALIYIYDIGGKTDGRKAMKFSEAVENFKKETALQPLLSGQEIIFADIVRRVIREGPWLVIGMFLLVFLICWLDFRNLRDAVLTMVPVLGGFVFTGASLVFLGTQINFYNMVALASLGAMVVDNSVHLYHRYLELKQNQVLGADLGATYAVATSVLACTLTSICGYGGMLFARHVGVASLGRVAVIGLCCCFLSSIIFFPAWLNRWEKTNEK